MKIVLAIIGLLSMILAPVGFVVSVVCLITEGPALLWALVAGASTAVFVIAIAMTPSELDDDSYAPWRRK